MRVKNDISDETKLTKSKMKREKLCATFIGRKSRWRDCEPVFISKQCNRNRSEDKRLARLAGEV